eukprot:scaffold9530_cov222-Alexandrium_tamarense.AAC.6
MHDLTATDYLVKGHILPVGFNCVPINTTHCVSIPFVSSHAVPSGKWCSSGKVEMLAIIRCDPKFTDPQECF